MFLYIVIALLPCALKLVLKDNQKTLRNIFFCVLVCFIGLRATSVGSDTKQYEFLYQQINSMPISQYYSMRHTEPLFLIFNKLIGFISHGNFRVYLIACALVFAFCLCKFIYNESTRQDISWLLVICCSVLVFALSGIRSSFGLAFGLLAIQQLFNEDFRKKPGSKICFVIFFIVACLFHYSAMIYGLIYPIYLLKKKKNYYLVLFLICLFALFGTRTLLPVLGGFLFSQKEYNYSIGGGLGYLIFALAMRAFLSFAVSKDERNEKYQRACCFMEITFAIQLVAINFSLFSRVTQLVFTPALVYFSCELEKTRIEPKVIQNIIICFLFLAYYCMCLIENSPLIVPYRFM